MRFADLDLNKIYTYADYYSWKFDERVELIKGKIFRMSPAPNRFHQEISGEIFNTLKNFLRGKPCKVYAAPFDVRLPRNTHDDKKVLTVLQPDICVICDPAKLDSRGCIGAPDLVVEILSPGNNTRDMKNKYEAYEEAEVKEYWVVSPQDQTFIVHTLVNGRFVLSPVKVAGDVVTSAALPGISIDLTDLFSNLESR